MTWSTVNGNPAGTRYDPSVNLTKETISSLYEKFKIEISNIPHGYADVYTNVTEDEDSIYLTTQAQYNEQKQQVPIGGEIIAVDKKTGTILWKRLVSDYSGVPLDYSRSAPAIWKNYLYAATGIGVPQSISPYETTLKNLFSGTPVQPTGTRQSLLCINKKDGSLVWRTFLGKVAQHINDEDNWVYITQAPFVFQRRDCKTIVAVGTSSGQSFQGWFYTNEEPFTGLSLSDQFDFQMTDIGKLYLIDAKCGKIIHCVYTGPEPLKKGDICPPEALPPSQDSVLIRYVIKDEDILPGGSLNPVSDAFALTCPIIYVLEHKDSARVPDPLDGITIIGTDGLPITLVAGKIVTPLMNKVVVTTTASFVSHTDTVFINNLPYKTYENTTGLVGGTGLRPARIRKRIFAGQILDEKDAYGLSNFGSSVWGNSLVIDSEGTTLYFGTGQPHAVCAPDESFVTSNLPTFLDTQGIIDNAQKQYEQSPTDENYGYIQDAYALYAQVIDETLQRKTKSSPRFQKFHFCSIIAVDIRPGKYFGHIKNVFSSSGYDFWQYGFTSLFSRSQGNPNGWSDAQLYYDSRVGPDGDFGQGPYLGKDDRIIALTKSGYLFILDKNLNLLSRTQIGNSVVNGASNYGSSISGGNILGTIVTQAYYPQDLNVIPPNFSPQLSWYISKTEFYKPQQSSFIAVDLTSGTIKWTRPLILSNTNPPYACSLAQTSSTDNFFIVPAANGEVYFLDVQTGDTVYTLNLDGAAGQSGTIVVNNVVYAVLGRSGLGGNFNSDGAQYGPAQHLFVYELSQN